MRYLFALAVAIFSISSASAAFAQTGDDDGFSDWASGKSHALDRQWDRVTEHWAPEPAAPDGTMSIPQRTTIGMRAPIDTGSTGTPSLPTPGIGTNWTHTYVQFTDYSDGMLFQASTRNRPHPARGVSRLSSPAAATRGSFTAGRTPFNRNARYTRTIHTKGRNVGSRLSAPLHSRITRRSVTRTPSALHGASRMRRQPSRGRW